MSRAVYATVSIEALTAAGQAADWVRLFPIGDVQANDGRKPWRIQDLAHAQAIVAASLARAGGRELPIDYDHQTDFGAVKGVGGQAPAAGWMKTIEARADGIWAQVEWTAPAAEKLSQRVYRYISPTFTEAKDRRVGLILRAALTNNPALDLGAVASGQTDDNEDLGSMLKDIALALGLPETATQEEVLAAITANAEAATAATAATAALAQVRTAAGLADDADPAAITAAVTTLRAGDGTDLATLRGQVVTLTTTLNTLQAATARDKAEAAVGALVKAGKIVPATRETFITMAVEQPEEFARFCAAQPVIVAPGDVQRDQQQDPAVTLTAEDRSIAASMGLTEEEFLAAKKD